VLAANQRYAASRFPLRLPARASRGLALLTCIDSRIDPLAALGLQLGEAKILRNAGGRVTPDVLRSLVVAVRLLEVDRILVMHHTQCGLIGTREGLLEKLAAKGPLPDWDFLALSDPDRDLRSDVQAIRACPFLPPDTPVAGGRYDVESGRLEMVLAEGTS